MLRMFGITLLMMLLVQAPVFADEGEREEPDIRLYYLHYSPFVIEGDENGPGGLAAPRLMELLEKSGLTWKFYYVPWTRALQEVERSDNALVFPFTISEERQKKYEFILPLYKANIQLLTLRSSERTSLSREEARSGDLKTVCYRETVQCDIFRNLGFPERNIIQVTGRVAFHSPRLVARGRADFFVGDYLFAEYSAENLGIAKDTFKPIEGYQEARTDYLAGGASLRSDIMQKLRAAAATMEPLE